MISHLSHRLLPQGPGWTTPTGSGNADVYAAQDAQRGAAPSSAAAMAANVSAAAGLGAQPTSFAAAMNAASAMPGAATDDDGDSESDGAGEATTGGASGTSDPQQLALAGPLLGHHHGSVLSSNAGHGAALPGTPGQSQGQSQGTMAPSSSSVANALQTYQSVARGLH
jgi:hypothetical protein